MPNYCRSLSVNTLSFRVQVKNTKIYKNICKIKQKKQHGNMSSVTVR